ncbi:dimethylglycine dehydrogenase [Achromobacter pulmonis]|uniref:Dimethylglycine dehydrogenase n=1 Tax=Achromobacter pulmonis TaxID=1389932 RepID=A0A2N8KPW6_9BURK|nr:DJ-1/PfpI family protein [Achromobacter pulmonis]PND35513.1 dimethylglycine dehydrogenase [Achromobacter pulmonis]
MHVNFLLFEGLTQLDMTGPYEVLANAPGFTVDFVAKTRDPVRCDRGLRFVPTQTLASAPPCDLLVVPGGPGTDDAIVDPEWVDFTRRQGLAAGYVFGICTGSLLLGAAGLLRGKRASSHWRARELLARFGATPSGERLCVDGRLFTAGGVTSGIDMALLVVAQLCGEDVAKLIQLQIEYDPKPPFPGGTPETSEAAVVQRYLAQSQARFERRSQAVERAAAAMPA